MTERVDFFTLAEVKAAVGKSVLDIEKQISGATMARINKETGQENLLKYMAYRLQWIAGEHSRKGLIK